jgi:hypothetical protein
MVVDRDARITREVNPEWRDLSHGKANLELESFLHDWPGAELCRIEVRRKVPIRVSTSCVTLGPYGIIH